MDFHKRSPKQCLSQYVRHYWSFEVKEEDLPLSQLYFPFGSFELTCHISESPKRMLYAGEKSILFQPTLFYAGQFTKPFHLFFDKPCKCIGISFHQWVGNLLYNTPSCKFLNSMVHLDELEKGSRIAEDLEKCNDKEDYYNVLEEYVIRKLERSLPDEMSKFLAEGIIRTPSRKEVNRLLEKIGLSRRRIEQRFIASTGLSLGTFTRKIRFQRSIGLLKKEATTENLTQIGLQAGYYDQPHFINEFKDFANMTPKAFMKQNNVLKDFLKSLTLENTLR